MNDQTPHAPHTGRLIGAAMLASFGIGIYSNFGLQGRLFAGAGALANAATQAGTIGLITLLGLGLGLLSLWVGLTLQTQFGSRHPRLSGMVLGLAIAGLAAALLEMATLNLMRSLSEFHLSSAGQDGPRAEALKAIVGGLRDGIHFPDKLLGGFSVFCFNLLLWQARSLPRPLAMVGMGAALLQMGAVALPLFGHEVFYPLLAPLALSYLASGLWLLIKGFAAPPLTP